ncbi:MAG: NAD-binding protein [Anaerolineales bacterium]
MNFVVVGCGRVGSELSYRLFKNGHQVIVVDSNKESFKRLNADFRGRIVEGEALSQDTWQRADVEHVDGVAVVTNSDTLNAVIAHLIRSHYPQVKQILVRNYDPSMKEMLETFGHQYISSTSWGAERLQELLIDSAFGAVFSAGNGEVEVYEMSIPPAWNGVSVEALLSGCKDVVCAALTRAGRAQLPASDTTLQSGDILTVSATLEGVKVLRARLKEKEA